MVNHISKHSHANLFDWYFFKHVHFIYEYLIKTICIICIRIIKTGLSSSRKIHLSSV